MTEAPSPISTDRPIWDRFFMVAPLVVVGSCEPDGSVDFAPKHMAAPLGWQNYYAFVCSPRHSTYRNVRERPEFTVSFPRPEQMVHAALAAGPRDAAGSKPSLTALPAVPAREVDGALLAGSYLYLECALERIVDGFGENSIIVGRVVAASAAPDALRAEDRDDADVVQGTPLTAYVSPGRFARVEQTYSFPYHVDFRL
jgi:flavin reductase (DIM6/NTAB) family NADH-FMN oxidoreductase RutF